MRLSLTLAALAVALPTTPGLADPWPDGAPNRPDVAPEFSAQTDAPAQITVPAPILSTVTDRLDTPWAVAVLPGNAGYLVTERGGALHHVARNGAIAAPVTGTPTVLAQGQGGLLDLALDPEFATNRLIYLTYSAPVGGGASATAAARATLSEDHTTLSDVTEIFRQALAAAAPGHYGSRITPLPDGTLAITTGDRMRHADRAQDPATGYGAVLRVTRDGAPPVDNPFLGQPNALPILFSHGHRNPQGAAVDGQGRLWTLEHGPAGGDELNLIAPGASYGWPRVSYGVNYNGSDIGDGRAAHAPDFTPPRHYWDPVIAPGGMVFYEGEMFAEWQGDILAARLIAQAVVRLDLSGDSVIGEERLAEAVGRVRDIAIDEDGSILFVTDEGTRSRLMRLSR